jgi:ribosomal protein L7/L12
VAIVDWKVSHPEQWSRIQSTTEQARTQGTLLALRGFAEAQSVYEKARAPKEATLFDADFQEGAAPEPDYESAFFARFPMLDAKSYDVVLTEAGTNKISVVKVVRGLTGVGLKTAKDLVDSDNPVILRGVDPEAAMAASLALMEQGAQIDLVAHRLSSNAQFN